MRSQRTSREENEARYGRNASTAGSRRTERRSAAVADDATNARPRTSSRSRRSVPEGGSRARERATVERQDATRSSWGAARSGGSWLEGLQADIRQMGSPVSEYEYERSNRQSGVGLTRSDAGASRSSNRRGAYNADERDARASRRGRQVQAERDSGVSERESRRRERVKARADKMFSRQFADEPAPAEGAPRAAVYEGQMGAKHRKSARMQRSSSAGSSSAKVNVSGWLSTLPLTPRSIKVGTTILCALLVCVFLYAPAQQYYQAQREHDKLVVEYSNLEDRNAALNEQNDILASDAGMEDAVRQKYGYVKTGEQVAYVAGLSDEASAARRDSDELQANVLSSTVRAPEEWYTPLLDTFFGVK